MNISNDVYFIKGNEKSQEYVQEESRKKNTAVVNWQMIL